MPTQTGAHPTPFPIRGSDALAYGSSHSRTDGHPIRCSDSNTYSCADTNAQRCTYGRAYKQAYCVSDRCTDGRAHVDAHGRVMYRRSAYDWHRD